MEYTIKCCQCDEVKLVSCFYEKSGNNCKECVKKRVREVKSSKTKGTALSKSPSVQKRDLINETQLKSCSSCLLDLPFTSFYKNGERLSGRCKRCTSVVNKDVRTLNHTPTKNDVLLLAGKRCCTNCEVTKDVSEFYKKRESYESVCKVCKSEMKSSYLAANPEVKEAATERQRLYLKTNLLAAEARRKYAAAYVQTNKEQHNTWVRNWRKLNPMKSSLFSKRWRTANKDVMCFHASKRRASKMQATPPWAELEQDMIRDVYTESRSLQTATGIKYHVDHVVPLQSKVVCGLHCLANLEILSASENISKGNRFWPDMWLESDYATTGLKAA